MNRAFEADLVALDSQRTAPSVDVDFNVAPTKPAPIVIGRATQDGGTAAFGRELAVARWGLIPSWAKDRKIGNRLINARSETVAEKPAFRRAFAKRRALIPADGYYEWYARQSVDGSDVGEHPARKGKTAKQPFFIRPRDGSVMAMAGLYEFWKDPEAGEWVPSFTIITTSAEDDLGHIHDRMPLMVATDAFDDWLNPAPRPPNELLDLLIPAAPGRLDAYPVSLAVNNVRNNGPELIDPIAAS